MYGKIKGRSKVDKSHNEDGDDPNNTRHSRCHNPQLRR
jgi:hypothetical protein